MGISDTEYSEQPKPGGGHIPGTPPTLPLSACPPHHTSAPNHVLGFATKRWSLAPSKGSYADLSGSHVVISQPELMLRIPVEHPETFQAAVQAEPVGSNTQITGGLALRLG